MNMYEFFKKVLSQKKEINYLYFISILLFLCLLSLFLFANKDAPLLGIPLFFLILSLGQAFFEVCIFVLIAYLLNRWAPRWLSLFFISLSFILLLLHFTNFTMVRLMDTGLSYVFAFLFGSGIDHLFAALAALNMNLTMGLFILLSFLLIPLVGLFFYWLTSRIAHLKPLSLSLTQISFSLILILTGLFFLEYSIHPFLERPAHNKYQKILPLGTTFLPPTSRLLPLSAPIAPPRDELVCREEMTQPMHMSLPNIYFFIIETLRKDFVTDLTAPNLTEFAEKCLPFPASFSNANATHLSWFALLHANFPYHWADQRDQWKEGSIPLQYLKKLGYQIHVYSSADLHYYNMDKVLFGQNRQLADAIEEFSNQPIEPYERDALCMQALLQELKEEKTGKAFFIFLDATHSEYSFPKEALFFEPIEKEIDYLTVRPKTAALEGIKNRYRNAIHYVDSLIGKFFLCLKQENLDADSIVVITGDHGEEFFEEGALFHGTHLNTFQTSVPLYLKLPNKDWIPTTQTATHMDLMPSLLHYLTQQSDFSSLFDGQSLFAPNRWPYRIAVMQNGPSPPVEFLIAKDGFNLQARFQDASVIEIVQFQSTESKLDETVFDPLTRSSSIRNSITDAVEKINCHSH